MPGAWGVLKLVTVCHPTFTTWWPALSSAWEASWLPPLLSPATSQGRPQPGVSFYGLCGVTRNWGRVFFPLGTSQVKAPPPPPAAFMLWRK